MRREEVAVPRVAGPDLTREKTMRSATAVTISGTMSGWLMKAYLKVSPR
jgi:hypothetical protein